MKTQIVVPSSGVIELYGDIPLSLNYGIADIRTSEKRNSDYSKIIVVPGTDNNNRLLVHIFDIGAERLFNPNRKICAEIVVEGVPVMKGFMRLVRIITLRDNKIEYELELKGRLDDLLASVRNKQLTDIDWSDLNHTWDKVNIQNSWTGTMGTGYVYPWIDYGFGLPVNTMEVKCFRPATYVKEIWDRIFNYAGFEYSSNFLNSDYFKRLIIPFTSERFSRTESEIENTVFRAHLSSNQSFSYAGADPLVVTDEIRFNNDSTPPSSDAGNNYNTTPGINFFTAPRDGVYSFTAQATLHFEINISASIRGFIRLRKNSGIDLTFSNLINIAYTPLGYPSGADETRTVSWTGYLKAGETIDVTIYTSISALPGSQNNYISANALFYNSLNPEFTLNSEIPYSACVPQNVEMEDFLLAIIKMFNLYFEYDKDVSNKIYIEPRNDFYNSTIQDWSQKLDRSQALIIEPMGTLDVKRYILKYKRDYDWLNERYQASYQQVKDESYGIKIKTVDNDFTQKDSTLELIFSPTPQYSDTSSDRVFPRIIKTDTNTQLPGTVNANPRILYYGGELPCQQWTFYGLAPDEATLHTTYPYCGHIDHPVSPTVDLCLGVPKEIYYLPAWTATYTNNNIYNCYWKQFIDEITDKDSSIVTGWFHLTPADIAMLDFRHAYRFGFQNYRLNKICDYDPAGNMLTKCEFIKTKTAAPFVPSTVLLTGGRDSVFDGGEQGPSLPPSQVTLENITSGCVELRTVAEMQALAASNQLDPCAKYLITDPVGSSFPLLVTSVDNQNLTTQGQWITSGGICEVTYDLQSDFFKYLGDHTNQNFLHRSYPGESIIDIIPFDGTYFNNTIKGGTYSISHVTKCRMTDCILNSAFVILDHNGNSSGFPLMIQNVVCDPFGALSVVATSGSVFPSQVTYVRLEGGSGLWVSGESVVTGCVISEFSSLSLDNNGGDGSAVVSTVVEGNTLLSVKGVPGGSGTVLNACNISGMFGGVEIRGGENYQGKILNKGISTFDKTRDITGISGTFDFRDSSVVPDYNQSFVGIFYLTSSNASETITLFSFRFANYEHNVTFYGQNGKEFRFVNDDVHIFCKDRIDVVLRGETDWVEFRMTNQGDKAYEVNRSTRDIWLGVFYGTYDEIATMLNQEAFNTQVYDRVYITDKGVGLWIDASKTFSGKLTLHGWYNALNPDYQKVGFYFDVMNYALYHGTDKNAGVWHPGLTPSSGTIAIWEGSHWQNLTGNVGSVPNEDGINWIQVLPSVTSGYIGETDYIEYDFAADTFLFRSDKRRNRIVMDSAQDRMQWGNNNVIQINAASSNIDFINNRGFITGVTILESGTSIKAGINHEGFFSSVSILNMTASSGTIEVPPGVSVTGLVVSRFQPTAFKPITNLNGSNNLFTSESDLEFSLDVTNSSIFSSNTLTIPGYAMLGGIFRLTGGNATINSIVKPTGLTEKFRIFPDTGSTMTINSGAGVNNPRLSGGTAFNGTGNNGDFIDFIVKDGESYEYNRKNF